MEAASCFTLMEADAECLAVLGQLSCSGVFSSDAAVGHVLLPRLTAFCLLLPGLKVNGFQMAAILVAAAAAQQIPDQHFLCSSDGLGLKHGATSCLLWSPGQPTLT